MRLSSPRVEPVDMGRYTDVVAEIGWSAPQATPLDVTRLWARHPALMKALRPLQTHLMRNSTLSPRDRELVILRTGWLCCSAYELAQHAMFGLEAGLTAEEFQRVTEGPDAPGWSTRETLILRAVDEMIGNAFISDETWNGLASDYSDEQMLDLMSTVGRYFTVCVVLNSSGLQLEPDRIPFDHYLHRGATT